MKKNLLHTASRHPWFLLLLPAFVAAHISNSYQHLIDYRFVWRDVLLIFLLPAAAYGLFLLLLRSRIRAALLALPFTILFLFWGILKSWLDKVAGGLLASYVLWLPLMAIAFTFLFVKIRRRAPRPSRWLLYGNTFAAAWLLIEMGSFLFSGRGTDLGDLDKRLSALHQPVSGIAKPDIYYLIFDGYTASPVQRQLGRNPAALDSQLRASGFVIDTLARSNYNFTAFSLASIFNLDTLQHVDTGRKYFDYDYLPAVYTMFRSEWPQLLQKEGYAFANYSIFDFEGHPSKLPPFDIWYQALLYRQYNFFDRINNDIGWHLPARIRPRTGFEEDDFAQGRERQLRFLRRELPQVQELKKAAPLFVYAHYLVPHGPYTYDSIGRFHKPLKGQSEITGYLSQAAWCDRLILEAVAAIRAKARPGRPQVIILQGDHGLRFRTPAQRQLSFAALNAVYCSDGPWTAPAGCSHVNTFRILANRYFGKQLPLLPPKTFYLRDR
jgi:hypothetical protein